MFSFIFISTTHITKFSIHLCSNLFCVRDIFCFTNLSYGLIQIPITLNYQGFTVLKKYKMYVSRSSSEHPS
jgi:hypothetical protein